MLETMDHPMPTAPARAYAMKAREDKRNIKKKYKNTQKRDKMNIKYTHHTPNLTLYLSPSKGKTQEQQLNKLNTMTQCLKPGKKNLSFLKHGKNNKIAKIV